MKNTLLLAFASLSIALSTRAQHDPQPTFQGKIGKTFEESEQWYTERKKAPQGAPNVVWILLDDVGFGATSAFGGLIETPTFDRLADNGLRYTNFHTTGICSPTRAALLTGRNAHSVGMGHHAELATGFPGYSGDIPFETGTIAEIFRENGYNTYALGKWHGNRVIDLTAAGPFNRYPTGRGFDQFYGFLGGATDQWHPDLVEGVSPINIEPNSKHLNELLVDKTIAYIANQKSADPDKPFFVYFATGATHSPHQVSKAWIDKYKGKFDGGWDQYREEVFKRQVEKGLIPKGTKLPPRQQNLKAWNALSADEKKVYARFFETYAAFLSYTDYEIGRLVSYLERIGELENTAIFLMIGDNGGSKEGSYTGTTGGSVTSSGHDIAHLLKQLDAFGSAFTNQNYPLGWSQATNTPFRYWKSDVNSEGATHNPLVVHYPKGIKDKGTLRTQYAHIIDILPTTVEITGVNVPSIINGYEQRPLHGVGLGYTFQNPTAPTKHTIQYYELHGGRAIYKDGWKASVYHPRNIFGETSTDIHFNPAPFSKDKWELYNLNEDWNETNDLAAMHPQKLEELKKLFDEEALKYNVYPLKNYQEGIRRTPPKQKYVIYEGTTRKTRVSLANDNVSIAAKVTLRQEVSSGVVFSFGGLTGGVSLYLDKNQVVYVVNNGLEETVIPAGSITRGEHEIAVVYKENAVRILVDGREVAKKALPTGGRTLAQLGYDGISIGQDLTSPVTKKYAAPFALNGVVRSVVIENLDIQK